MFRSGWYQFPGTRPCFPPDVSTSAWSLPHTGRRRLQPLKSFRLSGPGAHAVQDLGIPSGIIRASNPFY